MNKAFLFIALDGLADKEKETLKVARRLSEEVEGCFGFKVNLDYLLHTGNLHTGRGVEELLKPIEELGRQVFCDLKMWNGKRTMASVARNLADLGVNLINVYALADDQIPEVIKATEGTNTKVLGVTVLTHYDEAYCRKHFRRTLPETVRHFAEVAVDAGCHGIILPGTALDIVADLNTEKVVPGVRPLWFKDMRHEEEITPGAAVKKGANILVCGSPIMKNEDPVAGLQKILSEIQ